MIKTAGFIIIVIMLAMLLKPSFSVDNFINENVDSTLYEKNTEYAEGFSEADFGDNFRSANDEEFMPYIEQESPKGYWETLLKLKFTIKFDEEIDDVIFMPKFTKEIKNLENKYIEIEGFIIPHDIASTAMEDLKDDSNKFMFSAFPVASCFFCGAAGAESVIEVTPSKPIHFDKNKIKIKGKLKLNDSDYLKLPYLLENAELVRE